MNCLSQEDGSDLYGMGSTVKPVFEVGPTVNACTRGPWLPPSQVPLRQPDGSKLRVIFVDSEGLGAIKSDEQHDLHIFSLAVLTSSLFIFNSTGAIDEANIKKLSEHGASNDKKNRFGQLPIAVLEKTMPDSHAPEILGSAILPPEEKLKAAGLAISFAAKLNKGARILPNQQTSTAA